MVKEILLGDNPFIGVSHLAQEKARNERREVSAIEAKVEVLKVALEGGATGFTLSTHQANLELLTCIAKHYPETLKKLNYYILVPYAQGYVRKANISGTVGLAKTVLKEIVAKHPLDFVTSAIILNIDKLAGMFIAVELDPYLKTIPRQNIKAILLHEVLTELIIAYNLADLLHELKKFIEKKLRTGFGLETRNIGQLKKFLEENSIEIDYIMTPLNPLGYQMAPSKEEAEKAVQELGEQGIKIIAINILASGAVTVEKACEYLKQFKDSIYAVAYGTTKPHRAKENAVVLRECLLRG
jgi:hypothetical protein